MKPGNSGGGKGPHFQTSTGRGDSQEIDDESTTSTDGWETPGGAPCESERVPELPVLRSLRQGVPSRRSGLCLRALPCQRRRSGGRWSDVRRHRGVRSGTMARGTGPRTEGEDVSADGGAAGVDSQRGRQDASAWDSLTPRPRGADGGGPRPGADL